MITKLLRMLSHQLGLSRAHSRTHKLEPKERRLHRSKLFASVRIYVMWYLPCMCLCAGWFSFSFFLSSMRRPLFGTFQQVNAVERSFGPFSKTKQKHKIEEERNHIWWWLRCCYAVTLLFSHTFMHFSRVCMCLYYRCWRYCCGCGCCAVMESNKIANYWSYLHVQLSIALISLKTYHKYAIFILLWMKTETYRKMHLVWESIGQAQKPLRHVALLQSVRNYAYGHSISFTH